MGPGCENHPKKPPKPSNREGGLGKCASSHGELTDAVVRHKVPLAPVHACRGTQPRVSGAKERSKVRTLPEKSMEAAVPAIERIRPRPKTE